MNTQQIDKILNRCTVTNAFYLGCFAADQIPRNFQSRFPKTMVVNIDSSGEVGSHWVAIYLNSHTHAEYYDSFGIWPPLNLEIFNFLKSYSSVTYNRIQLQSVYSKSCGKHAIYFIYQKCLGKRFEEIINRLRHVDADKLVSDFIRTKIFNS